MRVLTFCLLLFPGLTGVADSQSLSPDSTMMQLQESYRFFDSPVNPDWYLIRPGDQLRATFIGARINPLTFDVDPEGRIVDQSLGVIDVGRTTLTEAKSRLFDALSRHYTVSDIDIAIVSPRRVSVTISGAVANPGLYLGFTSQRVSELIQQAGGILPNGSRRHISFESEKGVHPVDLDRAHYLGDHHFDPLLYAGTHIYVPAKSNRVVHVIGSVVHPRDIEYVEGDELSQILELAGGPQPLADTANIEITSSGSNNSPSGSALRPGDVIFVPRLKGIDAGRSVKLFGAVTRPGIYALEEGETLAQLINRASGYSPRSNRSMTTVFRQVRTDDYQLEGELRYPIAAGPSEFERLENSKLKPGDSIFVPALLEFVRVRGAVASPSYVPYQEGQTAQYYIDVCGGFTDDADRESIGLYNRVAGLSTRHSSQIVPRDGDEVEVRRRESSR